MSEPDSVSRKRRLLVVAAATLVLLSAVLAVIESLSPHPTELLARARQLLGEGRVAEAKALIDGIDSDDPDVTGRIRAIRSEIDRLQRAKREDTREELALARAMKAMEEGDLRKAAHALTAAGDHGAELREEVARALAERARAATDGWDLQEARRLLELAKKARGETPEIVALEIEVNDRERSLAKLEELVKKAIDARARGEFGVAEAALRAALRLNLPEDDLAAVKETAGLVAVEAKASRDRQKVLDRVAALLDAGKVTAARRLLQKYVNQSGDSSLADQVDALRDLEKQGGKDAFLPARRALRWLAAHQDPKSGGFDAANFAKICGKAECKGRGNAAYNPGVSGLALMAFTAFKDLDLLGEFKGPAERCAGFLTGLVRKDGRAGQGHYNTSIVALALLERARAVPEAEAEKEAGARAVSYLATKGVLPDGGWRYTTVKGASDVSVTCWVLQALHAAREVGVEVPDQVVVRAVDYLDAMTNANGGTGYLSSVSPKPALTAAALLARQLFRKPDEDSSIGSARAYLQKTLAPAIRRIPRDKAMVKRALNLIKRWPDEYGWYYTTYAYRKLGGKPWADWGPLVEKALATRQAAKGHALGSWDPKFRWEGRGGRVYATAINALTLEAYYRHRATEVKK